MKILKELEIKGLKDGGISYERAILFQKEGKYYLKKDNEVIPFVKVQKFYTCSDCIHCIELEDDSIFYPFHGIEHKRVCADMKRKHPKYKVSFFASNVVCHPPCMNFATKYQYRDTDVRQFISFDISAVQSHFASIIGLTFDGKQFPGTFSVSGKDWKNCSFIRHRRIKMFYPRLYNSFMFDNEKLKGYKQYIEAYGLEKYHKEIKDAFSGNADFHGRIFDLNQMWFV